MHVCRSQRYISLSCIPGRRLICLLRTGPGDSLSSTQQVWIDVLLSAGIPVELCKVMTSEQKIAMEDKKEAMLAKRKETSEGKKKKKRKREESSEEDEEED